jgi:arylsulfatase A-like enzyme
MLHQDHRLGELVDRLKASGEWERTLSIVGADHSVAAGAWDYELLARDPQPPNLLHRDRASPMFRRGVSHVPLLFAWPGHIREGVQVDQPVSMIDVLPTLLDLLGMPKPPGL